MTRTRARMCTGKVRHPDKPTAEAAMWRMVREGSARRRLNAYRCGHCEGCWHVGHVGRRR